MVVAFLFGIQATYPWKMDNPEAYIKAHLSEYVEELLNYSL